MASSLRHLLKTVEISSYWIPK